jgi:hypothetical protein
MRRIDILSAGIAPPPVMIMTSRGALPPSGRAITTSQVADFKSEWPRLNRNQWPPSFRKQWPTSPGISTYAAKDLVGYSLPDFWIIVTFSKPPLKSDYLGLAAFHLIANALLFRAGLWWVSARSSPPS